MGNIIDQVDLDRIIIGNYRKPTKQSVEISYAPSSNQFYINKKTINFLGIEKWEAALVCADPVSKIIIFKKAIPEETDAHSFNKKCYDCTGWRIGAGDIMDRLNMKKRSCFDIEIFNNMIFLRMKK